MKVFIHCGIGTRPQKKKKHEQPTGKKAIVMSKTTILVAKPPCNPDDKKALQNLKERIVRVIPWGTFYMETFLKCTSLEWSETVPTAAIASSRASIALRFNRVFVEEYCKLEEELMMLVLHELHHVLYGHTTLFGKTGPAHNIAFDAVINARLCRCWRTRRHSRLFMRFYKEPSFPEFLLTPPPQWPDKPDAKARKIERERLGKALTQSLVKKTQRIRDNLYYTVKSSVNYNDILELLKEAEEKKVPMTGTRLLGNHEASPSEGEDIPVAEDPFLASIAYEMNQDMAKQSSFRGFQTPQQLKVDKKKSRTKFLQVLQDVLHRAGIYEHRATPFITDGHTHVDMSIQSVLPQWRDRLVFAKEMLFHNSPLIFEDTITVLRRGKRPGARAHIYLDVSGSMNVDLPWIIGALAPLEKAGLGRIFLFSTEVFPAPKEGLSKGALETTGGTDVDCILEHVAEMKREKRPRKIVIITDGYFGYPYSRHMTEVRADKIEIHGAITHTGRADTMKKIAVRTTQLPSYT